MTIKSATPHTSVIIETDNKDFPTYRRDSADVWWNLMGISWETCSYGEEDLLESAYQAYKSALETQSQHSELP